MTYRTAFVIFLAGNAAACGGGEFRLASSLEDAAPDVLTTDVDGESSAEDGGRLPGNDGPADGPRPADGGSEDRLHDASADVGDASPADGGTALDASIDARTCTPIDAPPSVSCNGGPVCTPGTFCEAWPRNGGQLCEPLPAECSCAETFSCACLLAHVPALCMPSVQYPSKVAGCTVDGGTILLSNVSGVVTAPGSALIVCTPDGG